MNSLERIQAAMSFERPDRIPVIAQVFGHSAFLAGVPLDQYVSKGEILARCQIEALEHYGYDAAFALMDVNVETEAIGSTLTYRPNQYPVVESHAVSELKDIDSLRIPDPHRDGRMPELLKAAGILRKNVGDDVLVVGCVLGPLTLVTQLLGAERALFLAIDYPVKFASLLDFATDVVIRFGRAQLEAGVHLPIVFDPSASPAVVPPQFFREFEAPVLGRVFSSFREAGSAANWLHIAGPAHSIFPFYPGIQVDIANFDYCVGPLVAQEILPRVCLDGNIRPLAFVDCTPDEIAAQSAELLDLFDRRGGFILSSGCEIPPEARPENVAAMVASASGR